MDRKETPGDVTLWTCRYVEYWQKFTKVQHKAYLESKGQKGKQIDRIWQAYLRNYPHDIDGNGFAQIWLCVGTTTDNLPPKVCEMLSPPSGFFLLSDARGV